MPGKYVVLTDGNTYQLLQDGSTTAIRCKICRMISHHPEDIKHLYCGYCHHFHLIGKP